MRIAGLPACIIIGVVAVGLLLGCAGVRKAPESSGTGGPGLTSVAEEALFPIYQGGKWGYIDKSGDYVINPQFDYAWDFSEGLARVRIGDRRGYIDKTGMFVWGPSYWP